MSPVLKYVTDTATDGSEQWHFDYDPNSVYISVGNNPEEQDDWLVRCVANYWTYEKTWKFVERNVEHCNPYARVILVKDSKKMPAGFCERVS